MTKSACKLLNIAVLSARGGFVRPEISQKPRFLIEPGIFALERQMTESEARAAIRTPGHYAMRPLDQFVVTHSVPKTDSGTDPSGIQMEMKGMP